MNILVAIYNPVDLFPPTINAIEGLAKFYRSVTVLTNGLPADKRWIFPGNVTVHYVNDWTADNINGSFTSNVKRFTKYLFKMRRLLKAGTFQLVVLYEPHAALAYRLIEGKRKSSEHLLWYHNHDIFDIERMRKYSLGWFAARAEQKIFPALSIFSLPADERQAYFPMKELRGRYFFLPNYPSIALYGGYHREKTMTDEIRLLYQGKIAEGHGLEELISLLSEKIGGKMMTLHIKGSGDANYTSKLAALADSLGVSGSIHFYELTSYREVPRLAASCHVGIGIHSKTDIMHLTLGTSSNKIYEYAAAGMPVLIHDNEHFRKHLGDYSWAVFTDSSRASLLECLSSINAHYKKMSNEAFANFMGKLNYEVRFKIVTDHISAQLSN